MPGGTRDALINAAEQLLDEGDVRAVTLRAVGGRAGVSHNAPYKHFASKETLLAAVAARELAARGAGLESTRRGGRAIDVTRAAMHRYVAWAAEHPERFRLVFGRWTIDSAELTEAATVARGALVSAVAAAQSDGDLPPGDPERLTGLLLAAAHGAATLAAAGHLAPDGKGRASPDDLVDDLFTYLCAAAYS